MIRLAGCLGAAALAAACQTTTPYGGVPALPETNMMGEIEAALAKAFGRASVELGPRDEDSGQITVLPPPLGPYEDRSLAVPVTFGAYFIGEECVLIEVDGEMTVDLPQGSCRPA